MATRKRLPLSGRCAAPWLVTALRDRGVAPATLRSCTGRARRVGRRRDAAGRAGEPVAHSATRHHAWRHVPHGVESPVGTVFADAIRVGVVNTDLAIQPEANEDRAVAPRHLAAVHVEFSARTYQAGIRRSRT